MCFCKETSSLLSTWTVGLTSRPSRCMLVTLSIIQRYVQLHWSWASLTYANAPCFSVLPLSSCESVTRRQLHSSLPLARWSSPAQSQRTTQSSHPASTPESFRSSASTPSLPTSRFRTSLGRATSSSQFVWRVSLRNIILSALMSLSSSLVLSTA